MAEQLVLDYTSRDFEAIRSQLVGLAKGLLPEWETAGEPGDFGTLLLELFAYSGDVMNYYADRIAGEAFLGTAVRRSSVLYLADMMGYTPLGQRAAVVPLEFTWPIPDPQIYAYGVSSATFDNGVATLVLTKSTGAAFRVVVGSTITVNDVGTTFDGSFLVTGAELDLSGEELTVTYDVSWREYAPPYGLSDAEVVVGQSLIIPDGTSVQTSGASDDPVTHFTVLGDLVLNSDPSATGAQEVVGYATGIEGQVVVPTKVGVSRGIPNAEFVIPDPGVVAGSVEVFTHEGGHPVSWTEINKVAQASPTQSAFATYVDDSNLTHILFGDNSAGRIPPINSDIYIGYRYGRGAAANSIQVGAVNALAESWARDNGVTVTNTSVPEGGADVESVESMRRSIPRARSILNRAVTVEDYADLALQVPGVAKAVSYGTNYTSIYVRVAYGPSSSGYQQVEVEGGDFTTSYVTAILPSVSGILEGRKIYLSEGLEKVGGGEATPPGNYVVSRVWPGTPSIPATEASGDGTTTTIFTNSVSGLASGQYVTVSGFSDGDLAVTKKILSVDLGDPNNAVLPSFTIATSFNGSESGGGAVQGLPCIGFSSSASNPGVLEDPAGGITFLDSAMEDVILAVESYLADKVLAGSVVYAEPPEWTNITFSAVAHVLPLYNRSAVQAAVKSAVEDLLAFDAVDFGERVSVGDVYRKVLAVPGVDYLTIDAFHPEFALTRTSPTDVVDRGQWTTGVGYVPNDVVTECRMTYICLEAHTSGEEGEVEDPPGVFTPGTFADALAAGLWKEWPLVQDIEVPSTHLPRAGQLTVGGTGGLVNT